GGHLLPSSASASLDARRTAMATQASVVQTKTTAKKSVGQFIWEARTKGGELKKGEMEASDIDAVNNRLKSLGLNPTKVRKKGALDGEIRIPGIGGVTGKDLLIFTRQFATMIDAGLPLVQCLDILGGQAYNPAFRRVIDAIKAKVESGSTFADALKEHPKVFDELFVQLCAAGEVGGILDTILNRLATYREKAEKLKRKVKGAMIYPAIVICVAIGVTAILLLKVTPVFAKMFSDFGSALPGPTQMVVDLSTWLQQNFLYMLGGLVLLIFAWTAFYRTPRGRKIDDKALLQLPLFGPVIRKVAVARFTRTLGTMISS